MAHSTDSNRPPRTGLGCQDEPAWAARMNRLDARMNRLDAPMNRSETAALVTSAAI